MPKQQVSVGHRGAPGAHEEQLCKLLGQKAHPSPACAFTGTRSWQLGWKSPRHGAAVVIMADQSRCTGGVWEGQAWGAVWSCFCLWVFLLFGWFFFFLVLIKQFLHSPCQFLFQMYQPWFNREGCTAAPNAKNTGRAPCFHLTCSYFSFVLFQVTMKYSQTAAVVGSVCWESGLCLHSCSHSMGRDLELPISPTAHCLYLCSL